MVEGKITTEITKNARAFAQLFFMSDDIILMTAGNMDESILDDPSGGRASSPKRHYLEMRRVLSNKAHKLLQLSDGKISSERRDLWDRVYKEEITSCGKQRIEDMESQQNRLSEKMQLLSQQLASLDMTPEVIIELCNRKQKVSSKTAEKFRDIKNEIDLVGKEISQGKGCSQKLKERVQSELGISSYGFERPLSDIPPNVEKEEETMLTLSEIIQNANRSAAQFFCSTFNVELKPVCQILKISDQFTSEGVLQERGEIDGLKKGGYGEAARNYWKSYYKNSLDKVSQEWSELLQKKIELLEKHIVIAKQEVEMLKGVGFRAEGRYALLCTGLLSEKEPQIKQRREELGKIKKREVALSNPDSAFNKRIAAEKRRVDTSFVVGKSPSLFAASKGHVGGRREIHQENTVNVRP